MKKTKNRTAIDEGDTGERIVLHKHDKQQLLPGIYCLFVCYSADIIPSIIIIVMIRVLTFFLSLDNESRGYFVLAAT